MRRIAMSMLLVMSTLTMPVLIGCNRTVSDEKTTETKSDGTTKTEEKKVEQTPDGGTQTTNEKTVQHNNP